ncbi:MAG: GNAT family N-acetyltransferase [Demequinaceae bacterium]|nr:GNAT family N-acetyltransferase [Demequinaceae bacterium]
MSETKWRIPHRIETERLVLRCYQASDADEMSRVITASRHYLAPWMPWARDEPISAPERAELIATFIRDYDEGTEFVMGIFGRDTGAYVGGTGLHTRLGQGILEIGYWIAADQQRNGFVTEAAAALTQVSIDFAGAERVEIHHVPTNLHSRAVPERLEFTYEGRHKTLMPGVEELEATDIWVATEDNLETGLLASTPRPRLFDAQGIELEWPS